MSDIHIDDAPAIPAELNQHARVVCGMWLKYAHQAWLKGDFYECERLRQLARRKITEEMARTRACEE